MAEPCLNTSRRKILGFPTSLTPASDAHSSNRSAWAAAVAVYEAHQAELEAATIRDDEATTAYRKDLPPRPPLEVHLIVRRANGSKVTLPFAFGSERELRGPCLYEGTVLEKYYSEARRSLIPLWDEWHQQENTLRKKHRCNEAEAALKVAAARADMARHLLMEMPAPDLQAVLYKLRVLWHGDYMGIGSSDEKRCVVRDLARLSTAIDWTGGRA